MAPQSEEMVQVSRTNCRVCSLTSIAAKLNGLDPWAYLRDVLQRLPTQLNSRIDELLPWNIGIKPVASREHGKMAA